MKLITKAFRRYPQNIFILSFLINVFWILFVNTQPFSDFQYYHELAKEIANGGQWGDTYTSVGYPIVLGFLYKVFGANLETAKWFNVFLSLLNSFLVYGILRRLALTANMQKAILMLYVFFPMNIYYNSIAGTEILFASGLLGCICLYFSDLKAKYWLIGILTGLNTMVKPFFPAIFLVVLLTELLTRKKISSCLSHSLIVMGMAAIVIAPWLYRNSQIMGEFTYVSNNGGVVLYINNNSQNKMGGWMQAEDVENSVVNLPEYKEANLSERNKMFTAAAKTWIKAHPGEFIVLGLKRLAQTYFWMGDIDYALYGTGIPLTFGLLIIMALIKLPVFLIGIVTIIAMTFVILKREASLRTGRLGSNPVQIHRGEDKFNDAKDIFLILIFLMFTGIYFITEGQSRYSFPLVFIVIYYFFVGLRCFRNRRSLVRARQ